MIKGNLQTAGVGFKAAFAEAFAGAPQDWNRVAMSVSSTNGSEEYGWLGEMPGMREWVGDRFIRDIGGYDYRLKNKDFESTVKVDRNDLADDNLGIYAPMFRELGRAAGTIKDQLVYGLLNAGFTTPSYDGQFFFDTDHPVLAADGVTNVPTANTDGGSGTPWFLLDMSRAVKPIILQVRQEPEFVSKDKPTDDNVFMAKKLLYGVDARMVAGFGLWQMAWGSKQTLNATNYGVARAALMGMRGDYQRPLGIMPNLLVVPPALEGIARKLLKNELTSGGETNEWVNSAEVLVTPWLA